MEKTAHNLCVGDMLYYPEIEEIKQYPILSIEKDQKGIRVGTDSYYAKLKECDNCAAISTKVTYENKKRLYYFRIEDAKTAQRELRLKELIRLRADLKARSEYLDNFITRHFL